MHISPATYKFAEALQYCTSSYPSPSLPWVPRYQAKCDKLQLQNDELQGQLKQQVEDQEQRIAFLKMKSQKQVELNFELEEKNMTLQQAKDNEVGGAPAVSLVPRGVWPGYEAMYSKWRRFDHISHSHDIIIGS